jgi:hypothetical protein
MRDETARLPALWPPASQRLCVSQAPALGFLAHLPALGFRCARPGLRPGRDYGRAAAVLRFSPEPVRLFPSQTQGATLLFSPGPGCLDRELAGGLAPQARVQHRAVIFQEEPLPLQAKGWWLTVTWRY